MKLSHLLVASACFLASCSGSGSGTEQSEHLQDEASMSEGSNSSTDGEGSNSLANHQEMNKKGEESSAHSEDDTDNESASNSVTKEVMAAMEEDKTFIDNIGFQSINASKKLLSKYEYELYFENNNKILSLHNVNMKVVYKGKEGEILGEDTFEESLSVAPGEKKKVEWSVDWINLVDGTRACEFSIEKTENNLEDMKSEGNAPA